MPKPAVSTGKSELKFKGQTVVLAGKFSWGQDEKIRAAVLSEGGAISIEVSDGVTIIVGSDSRGTPAAVKEAEKLVKKGARIDVVKEDDLFARLIPNKDEMARMFKAGDAERFQLLTELDPNHGWGHKIDLSKCDFSDGVFDGYPLNELMLDDCVFNNASFRDGCLKVSRGKFHCAQLDVTDLSEMKECQFQEAELICLYIITSMQECDFSQAKFDGVSARSCKFKNTTFKKASLTNTIFDDSVFEACDFMSTNWQGCGANTVTFKNCSFKNATMKQAWLINCNFVDCDFTDCDLTNANLALSKFKNSKIKGAIFTGAILAGANFKELQAHAGSVKGLKDAIEDVSKKANVRKLPEVNELLTASIGSSGYEFQAIMEIPEAKISCRVYMPAYYNSTKVGIAFADVAPKQDYVDLIQGEYLEERETWFNQTMVATLPDALHHISCVFDGYSLLLDSVTAKIAKGNVKSKEFRNLAVRAWCAAFGTTALSDQEIKKLNSEKKESSTKERDHYIELLRGGADGIKSFNEMMAERKSKLVLKKVDLSGCDLTGVNLTGAELHNANLENCTMKQCSLEFATLSNANLKGVILDQANCHLLLAESANFSSASMSGATFNRANLAKSCLHDTKCNGVDFTDTSLLGADLTNADLTDARFERTQYNEKTLLPKENYGVPGLLWYGYGTDPGKIREIMDDAPGEPLDFAKFLQRLEASIDRERLKKAIKMLQAESFQLFAEVKSEQLIGIVKSQTDPDLVYSCQLTSEGKFCCGTQNLNSCGGLRGALCKHLLVLLLGLTRAGELDATVADTWARASKLQNPKMEKDSMSETFLRYKGAEAGEIDWRPTETLPEDYYAF